MSALRPAALPILAAVALAGCALTPGRVPQIVAAPDARRVTVATASGPVVGAAAPLGSAFLGIPYAAPPVGPLRFRAPQPVAPCATRPTRGRTAYRRPSPAARRSPRTA